MVKTKTVRVHKKVYDQLVEVANYAGISVGSVITQLATMGCQECGRQILVNKDNYHRALAHQKELFGGCLLCSPHLYTAEQLKKARQDNRIPSTPSPPAPTHIEKGASVEHVS